MTYRTVYKNQEICSIVPPGGWMYPEHDEIFHWFAECFTIYYETYKKVCDRFDVVVQAGGHCGIGPKLLSTLFKTVYTFEPNPHSFHCLVNNCQDDNIIKINACLGRDRKLVYQWYHGQKNIGVSLFKEPEVGIEPTIKVQDVDNIEKPTLVNIPQIRIDDLGLKSCDLIHLDVEGYEGKIIDGALETIEKYKPTIIFESMDQPQLEILKALGYSPLFVDGHRGDNIMKCCLSKT